MSYSDDDEEPPCLVALGDEPVYASPGADALEKARNREEQDLLSSALPPCPVTILSGFLGSGKTTLIQNILQSTQHGKRIAVIENEFGEGLSVESLIARDGMDDASNSLTDLIELPNGCVCCTVKDSLVTTLEGLLNKRNDLDYILIECSGMANPGPIASLFWLDEALESRLCLDGIVVDAKNIQKQLMETQEASQQIAYADRILVNKVDLIENVDSVLADIQRIQPTAPCRLTSFSQVNDLNWILDAKCFDANRLEQMEATLRNVKPWYENTCNDPSHDHSSNNRLSSCQPASHQHTDAISTIALIEEGSMDLQNVHKWLASILWPNQDEQDKVLRALIEGKGGDDVHGTKNTQTTKQEIFRIKGILSVRVDDQAAEYSTEHTDAISGIDSRRFVVQAVYDLWEIHPGSEALHWDDTRHDDGRVCKLVIIGKDLDETNLRLGFRSCKLC